MMWYHISLDDFFFFDLKCIRENPEGNIWHEKDIGARDVLLAIRADSMESSVIWELLR